MKKLLVALLIAAPLLSFSQAEAILDYAAELMAEGEYTLALQQYELAGDVDRGNADARVGRGICQYYLGNYEEAINELGILHEYGDFPEAEYYVGLSYAHYGAFDRALYHYDLSLALDTVADDIFFHRGRALFETGKYQDAIQSITGLENDSTLGGQASYYLASAYQALDSTDIAMNLVDKALDFDERLPKFWRLKGDIYFSQKEDTLAVAMYTQSLARNPDYLSALASRGMAYKSMKKYALAAFDFERCLKSRPEDWVVLEELMGCYYAMDSFEKFMDTSNRLMQVDPSRIDILYKQGLMQFQTERYEEALETYSVLADAFPDDPEVHFQLANSYFAIDDFTNALYHYSIAAQTGHQRAQFNMAATYFELDQKDKACELWKMQSEYGKFGYANQAKENLKKFCEE